MKKKCSLLFLPLFVCLVLSSCTAMESTSSKSNAEITIDETNFPEDILRQKASEADKNKDNLLTHEEAASITELYIKKLEDYDIVDVIEDEPLPEYKNTDFSFDFEGIQHFTALTKLDINLIGGEAFNTESDAEEIYVVTKNFDYVYELTNLTNLTLYEFDGETIAISDFPKLKRLQIHLAHNLTSITLGNTNNLKHLWISECDMLEKVDISSLNNLEELYLNDNSTLSTVTVSTQNTNLELVNLENLDKLTTFDFSGLSGLKQINLTHIPLKSIDVSNNTLLEEICVTKMELDTLDLTSNPNITYIINDYDSLKDILLADDNIINMIRWTNSAITEFPVQNLNPETLEGIDIQGTNITSIDVSKYKNLQYFYYDDTTTVIGYEEN